MALAFNNLETTGTATDGTSNTSGSFTPTADSLIIACYNVERGASTDPNSATISDTAGLTWSSITDFLWMATGTGRSRLQVWAAKAPSSPSSMTVTFSHGATTCTGFEWSILEATGSDVSNGVAQCFVQGVTTTVNSTGTNYTITLSAATNSNNRTIMWASHLANEIINITANYTGFGFNHASPGAGAKSQVRTDTFDTGPTANWTTSIGYGAVAYEIKAADSPTPLRALMGMGS